MKAPLTYAIHAYQAHARSARRPASGDRRRGRQAEGLTAAARSSRRSPSGALSGLTGARLSFDVTRGLRTLLGFEACWRLSQAQRRARSSLNLNERNRDDEARGSEVQDRPPDGREHLGPPQEPLQQA